MDNTYNVHNEEENNSLNININYVRPIFHRRVLANMIDFFIFAFLWLISFTIAGNIAKSTNSYKEKQNYINTIHLNSDLYKIDNTGKIYSVVSYYNHYQLNTTTQEKNKLREHIDNFIVFISNEYGEESKEEIQKMYDDFRLNDNMKEDGIPYFIVSDNKIIENNNSENNNITLSSNIPEIGYVEENMKVEKSNEKERKKNDTNITSNIKIIKKYLFFIDYLFYNFSLFAFFIY